MARRRRSSLALSTEQARQALTVLVQEGKLTASEVRKALERRERLIRELRARLTALETGVGKVGKGMHKDGPFPIVRKARSVKRKVARRKPRISTATPNLYHQRRYMAALRRLSKEQPTKIIAILKKSGVKAAIAAAPLPGDDDSPIDDER